MNGSDLDSLSVAVQSVKHAHSLTVTRTVSEQFVDFSFTDTVLPADAFIDQLKVQLFDAGIEHSPVLPLGYLVINPSGFSFTRSVLGMDAQQAAGHSVTLSITPYDENGNLLSVSSIAPFLNITGRSLRGAEDCSV